MRQAGTGMKEAGEAATERAAGAAETAKEKRPRCVAFMCCIAALYLLCPLC